MHRITTALVLSALTLASTGCTGAVPTSHASSSGSTAATTTAVSVDGFAVRLLGDVHGPEQELIRSALIEAGKRVAATWGADRPPQVPVTVWATSTNDSFRALGGDASPSDDVAATAVDERTIVLSPTLRLKLTRAGVVTVLAHELTHIVQRQVGPNAWPKWLSEGSAEVTAYRGSGLSFAQIAPQVASAATSSQQQAPPPSDAEFATGTTTLQRAYQRAWSWCSFLIYRFGWSSFTNFVREVAAAPNNWAAAFRVHFAPSPASLSKAYAAWLARPVVLP